MPMCLINLGLFHEDVWGSGSIAPLYFTLALDVGELSTSHTGCFIPEERVPGTHWIGGWWAPEPVWMLWRREESLSSAGIEP
jgi:hypothetical protein